MRRRDFTLDVRSANQTGNISDVKDLRDLVVEIRPATFTATVQIQASLDGTSFTNIGSSFVNAGGFLELSSAFSHLRAVTSGFVAGTLSGAGAGRDSRTDV